MWHEVLMSMWPLINSLRKVLIPLLEGWFRLADSVNLLGLRLIGLKTIREIVNGDQILKGRKFLIFATYPIGKLPSYHLRLLKKFESRGYTIIVASNSIRAKRHLEPLLHEPWVFLFRRPFGRDFGCYKDCALMLYEYANNGGKIDRVILLNDSVATFEPGEDKLIEHLDNSSHDFAGITENYEFGHHVGSFMIGLSGEAFMSKHMVKFWRNYKSISTRRYAIYKGEIGISRALKKAGYNPSVLYTVDDLDRYLVSCSLLYLESIYSYMPIGFINKFGHFVQRMDGYLNEFIHDREAGLEQLSIGAWTKLNKLPKLIKRQSNVYKQQSMNLVTQPYLHDAKESATDFDHIKLYMLRYRDRLFGWSEDRQKEILEKHAKEQIVNSMMSFVFSGSQIHFAMSILLFMGAGILKKDVIYRRLIEPYNLGLLLLKSGAIKSSLEIDEIVKDILAKGHPYSFQRSLYKRMLYDWDFI